jgi:hypothetical protein
MFFFLLIRICISYFLEINNLINLLLVGLITIILAPKFAVVKEQDGEKIKMKWIFFKGVKDVQ